MISNVPARISDGIRMIAGTDSGIPLSCNASEVISQQLVFMRVAALSSQSGQNGAVVHYEKGHEKLLAALYGQQAPWATVLVGDGSGLTLYLGLPSHGHYGALLHGVFPGIDFSEEKTSAADLIARLAQTPYLATMTGNPAPLAPAPSHDSQPTPPTSAGTDGPHGIDLFLQATRGHRMAYVVYAQPILSQTVEGSIRWFNSEELEVRSTYLRRGTVEENNNPEASRYCDLLLAAKEKFAQGQKNGMWQIRTLVLADHSTSLANGMQALNASFANPANKPQPIRVRRCGQGPYSEETIPSTPLTSAEAACIARFPSAVVPGIRMRPWATFGDLSASSDSIAGASVAIGKIVANGTETDRWFEVALNALCKHALVVGVPGSGKTQLAQYLIWQLWYEHKIPCLVIEPSGKTEFRKLLHATGMEDLLVFTVGNENASPLRFNPLAISPGVNAQTHIEGIATVIKSAFALEPPLPYVLTQALYRVYSDRGWDLVKGSNPNGFSSESQPILTDLVAAIHRIVAESTYAREIKDNILGALAMRLQQLTLGSKALLFGSRDGLSMADLAAAPTVLELAAIGDDDEKAFLMAAILMSYSLHLQSQGLSNGKLKHATLIDEAHRLLRATLETAGTSEANPRARAVESFCNILAEMRAYGESLIILDQVPSKLAPDVVKNTGLKVILRLVAKDDRELVAGAMLLDEQQTKYLATLSPGEAVIYTEGMDQAVLAHIPNHASALNYSATEVSNDHIMDRMADHKVSPSGKM